MKFTFGKTIAAQKLEQLLENNPVARRKISTLLSDYTNQLLLVAGGDDARTVRLCMELLRDYTLRRIHIKKDLTKEIRTYTENVVIARHRVFRKEYDTIINMMTRRLRKKT